MRFLRQLPVGTQENRPPVLLNVLIYYATIQAPLHTIERDNEFRSCENP